MDLGFSEEKLSVCLATRLRSSFLVTPSFGHPSLSLSLLASLHLARSLWLSEAQLCVVRDHILLTLLQEF